MGIDTIIDFPCIPKDLLTTEGIIERLKGRERAEAIIKLYREQGDYRPLAEIGFEMTRRAADGTFQTDTVIVAEALENAKLLDEVAEHCIGCPGNRTNEPFGCIHTINFPISEAGEIWLLRQLPPPGMPLLKILNRGIEQFGYDGESFRKLRLEQGIYFESEDALARPYVDDDLIFTTDMLFEMMFMVGAIEPSHAVILLLALKAIPRDNLSPETLFWIMNGTWEDGDEAAIELPFLHNTDPDDDSSVRDLKNFLHMLYLAYRQHVRVLVDL